MRRVTFIVAILLVGQALLGQSVPSFLNYQGKLTNSQGQPLATGNYVLTFRIYDAPTGGNLIWGPQLFDGGIGKAGHGSQVPVVLGYFNVVLGPVDTTGRSLLTAFAGPNRSLEIQVASASPISPRQQVLSAGYAVQAEYARNGVPSGTIIMWSGALAAIPSGWKLCDGTRGTPDLRDRFLMGASNAENPGAIGGEPTHQHQVGVYRARNCGSSCGFGTPYVWHFWQAATVTEEVKAGFVTMESPVPIFQGYAGGGNHPFNEVMLTSPTASLPPYYKIAYLMKE